MKINEATIIKVMNVNNLKHITDAIRVDLDNLRPKIMKLLNITADYIIKEHNVYVAVSLGKEITQLTAELWRCEDYFKAMVLDTVLTDLLFTLSKVTYQEIRTEVVKMNQALSKRLTPGDDLDLSMNKTILDQLPTSLSCNDYYVIEPINSLVYTYIIQDEFDCNEDISCHSCKNNTCHLRSKYEHIN